MPYHPATRTQKFNFKAVAWALLSQSIWLPAFISVSHDSLVSSKNDYRSIDLSMSPSSTSSSDVHLTKLTSHSNTELASLSSVSKQIVSSGILLNSLPPYQKAYNRRLFDPSYKTPYSAVVFSAAPSTSTGLSSITNPVLRSNSSLPSSPSSHAPGIFRQLYNPSDLLGGTITLQDINEPLIPPIARAQMAKYLRSGDPLSPIPALMRESMRQALKSLATNHVSSSPSTSQSIPSEIDQARVVHVPSTRLKRSADVPLALQSDGSVDILNVPSDPAVVDEIKTWSMRQSLPSHGRMVPAVVHFHPITESDQTPASESDDHSLSRDLQGKKAESPNRSTALQPSSIPQTQEMTSPPEIPPHPVDPADKSSSPPSSISKITSEASVAEGATTQLRGDLQ